MLPFKISVLVFVKNSQGDLLLLQRKKEPNKGCWSPVGGKLEMGLGESPYETAIRETAEESGLEITEEDLHLFCMISEKGYEGDTHWLMFLFDCTKALDELPPEMDEGNFEFFAESEIEGLNIPETDKELLWPIYLKDRAGFTVLRTDCTNGMPENVVVEQK